MVILEAVDRRMKRMEKAEIGNINDKHILNFGPYVDVVQSTGDTGTWRTGGR